MIGRAEQTLAAAIRGAVRLGLAGHQPDSDVVRKHIERVTERLWPAGSE